MCIRDSGHTHSTFTGTDRCRVYQRTDGKLVIQAHQGSTHRYTYLDQTVDWSKGTVTQSTDIETAVTLNNYSGQITTVTDGGGEEGMNPLIDTSPKEFTVNNNKVAADDTVSVSVAQQGSDGTVVADVSLVSSGSFKILLREVGDGSGQVTSGPLKINFRVHKPTANWQYSTTSPS